MESAPNVYIILIILFRVNINNDFFYNCKHFRLIVVRFRDSITSSYSGPSDFSRPCIFSPSTRPKSAHVSNTALICGEGPPNILLLAWMQFKNEPSD